MLSPSLILIKINHSIKEVDWLTPGSQAAHSLLDSFIEDKLPYYAAQSNDPTKAMQSNLSPYLHFGQLSTQRVVLAILHHSQMKRKFDIQGYIASIQPLVTTIPQSGLLLF